MHDSLYTALAYWVIVLVVFVPGIYAYRKWKKSSSASKKED